MSVAEQLPKTACPSRLDQFEERWGETYAVISKSRRGSWSRVVPMFSYPSQIRRVIYTTNTIESLNMTLRKLTKNRSLFPNDEALFWSGAMNQFAILFDWRVPIARLSQNSLTQNPA
jgi:putative transposase